VKFKYNRRDTMPITMTVDWKHVLLDPKVFQSNGTFRVARVRGGLSAFPIGASGKWESEHRHWSPDLAGSAPDHYNYEGRRFNFGFWSIKEFLNGVFYRGGSNRTNEFDVNYTARAIRIEATALYYWDFGDGEGDHAVFVDAFDDANQQFIPDDFVDVIPDDERGSLTAEANNGRLSTNVIENAVIRARTPTGDNIYLQYRFSRWTNEQDLSRISPKTVPTIMGRDIRIRQGSVIAALAHYNPTAGAAVPPVEVPPEGGYIIGIPADGPFIFVPLGGLPRPVGPWDPTLFAALLSSTQLGQLTAQIDELRKRIEALEKPR
jgi:hypothetical protein